MYTCGTRDFHTPPSLPMPVLSVCDIQRVNPKSNKASHNGASHNGKSFAILIQFETLANTIFIEFTEAEYFYWCFDHYFHLLL